MLSRWFVSTTPEVEEIQAGPDIPAGIPLERAMFCGNCETISGPARFGRCPHCGSAALAPVARWLQRPVLAASILDSGRRV